MAYDKDPKAKELVDAAVSHAEDIVEQGYSREVAITQSIAKFGVQRDVLEKEIPFFEGGKASDEKLTPKKKERESLIGMKEVELSKADGRKFLVIN